MPTTTKDKIILGIDPGTIIMGYGVLKVENNNSSLVALGVLHLKKYADHFTRLKKIFDRVIQLADTYKPDELAVESPFYSKNPQSTIKLGRAQGVVIAAALTRSIPIFEYAPRKIKQSVTGNGNASKQQLSFILQKTLKIKNEDMPSYFDATDALATALCHQLQFKNPEGNKRYTSWKDYVKKNE